MIDLSGQWVFRLDPDHVGERQNWYQQSLGEERIDLPGTTDLAGTVRKELVTFRMLWNWGVEEGLLSGPSPTKRVILPLTDENPPLKIRGEIELFVGRGGLTDE
ncbi:hypothetical protein OAS39_05860 [Pirellulales bacterium]|nr:hypothetical protein [Pirellulales bacterium]